MRHYNLYHTLCAMPLLALALTSCSSEEAQPTTDSGTPLQVRLSGISTRADIISSTTLPEESRFGIFVTEGDQTLYRGSNEFNIPVWYVKGSCSPDRQIMLDMASRHVYAYYPYNANFSSNTPVLSVETKSQTDYLYGKAIDSDEHLATINAVNPVANIQLKHVMALLTLHVQQDTLQGNGTCHVEGIRFSGVGTSGSVDLKAGSISVSSSTHEMSNVSFYPSTSKPTTCQTLVIPTSYQVSVSLKLDGVWSDYVALASKINSGYNYNFNVTVYSAGRLEVSETSIEPRTSVYSGSLTGYGSATPTGI